MPYNGNRRRGIAGIPGRNLNSVRGSLDISGLYPVRMENGGILSSQAEIEAERLRRAPANLPGIQATNQELQAAKNIYSDFLGDSGYDQERDKDRSNAKLQAALALAQAGFGLMGAQPGEGESPMSVAGRAFGAPLAGRMSEIAGTFSERDAARRAAQRAEERQIKLQAFQDVKETKQAVREQYQTSWNTALQTVEQRKIKNSEVSDKFTVDGKRVPVIVKTDWKGDVTYEDQTGNKIEDKKIGVYDDTKPIKDSNKLVPSIEMMVQDSEGNITYRPVQAMAVTSYGAGGKSETNLVNIDNGSRIVLSGPDQNARIAPKEGSKTSLYYAPDSTSIYLNPTFVKAWEMDPDMAGQQATLQRFIPKILDGSSDLPEILKVRVSGATYDISRHKGYDKETGNIVLDTPEGKVSLDSSQLWRLDDPKAFTNVGEPLYVGPTNLEEIRNIPGLSKIEVGGKLTVQENAGGEFRILMGPQTINLTPKQASLFLTRGLSEAERLQSGQTLENFTAAGTLRVGPDNWDAIKQIPGLSKVVTGDVLQVEENQLGEFRVRRGQDVISLDKKQTELFLTRDLTEAERIRAGHKKQEFKNVGSLYVVPGNLDELRKIPGLENIRAGDEIERWQIEGDVNARIPTQTQLRYLGNEVDISSSVLQSGVFQTQALDEVQLAAAGKAFEGLTSFVNTGTEPVDINGQPVGVGQTTQLTPSQRTAAFESNSGLATILQEAGPADMSAKTYTLRENREINDVEYAAGDQIRLNPSKFNSLKADIRKILSDDDTINRTDLKIRGFKALWKNVSEIQRLLPLREPSPQELESLLTMFPAGMRSGGVGLRQEIFRLIKHGPSPDEMPAQGAVEAQARAMDYKGAVTQQLDAARGRYEEYVNTDVLAPRSWDSLSFEEKRAFADLPQKMLLESVPSEWRDAQTRLATDRSRYTHLSQDDVAAYAAGTELLILAKHLRDSGDLSKTGRYFGWVSRISATTFADIAPLTDSPSGRLEQIINRMKASYGTLAATEGEGRPSNFRLALQQDLIPNFGQAEKLNRRNLDTIISRLETNLRSVFDDAVLTTTVIPQSFETMAEEAGITDFGKVDPRRYRWMDPNIEGRPPVTRQRVMQTIGLELRTWKELAGTRVGRLIEADDGQLYVKIADNDDGSIVIQQALSNGRPDPNAPEITRSEDTFNAKRGE